MKDLIETLSKALNASLPGKKYEKFSDEVAEIISGIFGIPFKEAKQLGHTLMIIFGASLLGGIYARNKLLITLGSGGWVGLILTRILKGLVYNREFIYY